MFLPLANPGGNYRYEIANALGPEYEDILLWALGQNWKMIPYCEWYHYFNDKLKETRYRANDSVESSLRDFRMEYEKRKQNGEI